MSRAWIGLGSNLGRREEYLKHAASRLSKLGRTRFASVYETDPVFPRGFQGEGGRFLNTVCALATDRSLLELFAALRQIEQENQRIRTERFAPRSLDIDLLDFDRLCLIIGTAAESRATATPACGRFHLHLPHPRLHLRKFVLIPWCELDPQWTHPLLKHAIADLLASTGEQGSVNLHCAASDLFL